MFGQISRQVVRNFSTNPIPKIPRPFNRVGSNFPFSINNEWALTIKFALFFSSAFYLPFFVLHHQLKKFNQVYQIEEQPKESESSEVYGLPRDEQEKKIPEIYL